ncbi:MAG: hypothetical protein HQK65_04610 [Desulfamplus sp.]|nr:hypothetical protein [Desulfamplus sp.]
MSLTFKKDNEHHNFTLMIGVSTRQNTANLVPFFQFDCEELILLETQAAIDYKWSEGIKRVINERGKKCITVPFGTGSNLVEMETKLIHAIRNSQTQNICWNFGGGQKLQQLALFNHFTYRITQEYNDIACYSEPQTRLTYIITPSGDNRKSLKNDEMPTNCFLDLDEILSIFGHTSKNSICLWHRTDAGNKPIGQDYLLTPEQEEWFDDFGKRQAMFKYMLDKENSKNNRDEHMLMSDKIFPIKFSTDMSKKTDSELGVYFERLMQTRITRIIASAPDQHRINQVWANVHVFSFNSNNEIAEYDLVLVTNFGTIIPIDAKSYEFKKKDEDARSHNLNNLSGVYTDFWSVFPYYKDDFKDDSILQTDKQWNKLLRIPFTLKERKSKMLSLSGVDVAPFHVYETKKNKIQISENVATSKDKAVKINTLKNLIKTLNITNIP